MSFEINYCEICQSEKIKNKIIKLIEFLKEKKFELKINITKKHDDNNYCCWNIKDLITNKIISEFGFFNCEDYHLNELTNEEIINLIEQLNKEELESKKRQKKSLKRKYEEIYFEERNDLLNKLEEAKKFKDDNITYNKLIKELEELIVDYHELLTKKNKI